MNVTQLTRWRVGVTAHRPAVQPIPGGCFFGHPVAMDSILTRPGPAPDRTIAYGEHPDQVIDVFDGGPTGPIAVMLHGGFWRPAYDRVHTRPMTDVLRQTGHTVVALEYRRIPGDPDSTVDDVRTGLQVVNFLSGTERDMVVLGHSAGGHLALWAASAAYAGIRGVIALAPVADLRLARDLQLGADAVAGFLGGDRPDLDPMQLPPPRVPITILHGVLDEIVPIALAYSYAEAHPGVRVIPLEDTGHYELIDPHQPAFDLVVRQVQTMMADAE
jgi:acetyl esterase/lipase